MTETLQQKIDNLYRELKNVAQKKKEANLLAKKFLEERKSIEEKIKALRKEADTLKNQRDTLNSKVYELKTLREKAKNERKEKLNKLLQLKETLTQLKTKKPEKSRRALEDEIHKLDWKLQTTPLTAQEERPIIEQLKKLETQLHFYKQLDSTNEKIRELQKEIDELTFEANQYHEELSTNADQSQQLHLKRLEIIKKIKELKTQADNAHLNFVQARQEIAALNEKYTKLTTELNALKQEQNKIEQEQRAEKEKEALSQVEEKAREKLKRGQKLTWEEFKAIAEKGLP